MAKFFQVKVAFTVEDSKGKLKKQSIMFWARQHSPEEFARIKRSTVNYYIDETITSPTEFDFANVLFQMYKHKYVCSGIIEKSWYVFNSHYWERDKGMSLRFAISTEIYALYREKMQVIVAEMQSYDPADPRYEELNKVSKHMMEVTAKLKRTNDKNNIMREAMEIFYDKDFIRNVDSNKYLLCYKNGVVDFRNKIFRDGYPLDYITKSTNTQYIPYMSLDSNLVNAVTEFMEQLFPVKLHIEPV
jgi:hypothetical protein